MTQRSGGAFDSLFAGDPDALVLHASGGRSSTRGALAHRTHDVRVACADALGPKHRIGLVVRDGLALVPAFMGIASHCGCVPLDANLPAARLTESLDALRVDVVLVLAGETTHASVAAAELGLPLWTLEDASDDELRCRATASPTAPPRSAAEAVPGRPRAALLLQTSGSTGPPKGVPQPVEHLVAGAANVADALELSADDRCLNPMPLFHVHGLVAGVLAPLSRGGSVHVCHGASDDDTVKAWRDYRPTWTTAVPTRHGATLAALRAAEPPIDVSAVRLLRTASAPMQADLQASLEAHFDAPVIEAYGMTEAAHQIASNPLPRGRQKVGSVGKPRGFDIEIRAADGERTDALDADEEGAVWILGRTLMPGYDGRDGDAAGIGRDGWFDTGDLGRLDADGYLHLTGRRSETINRGGEKVQPLAVDRVLQSHLAIDVAVAFAHPHPTLHEDVVAAALLRAGAKRPSEAELRALCFAELPAYQVPTRVLVLDELPSTSTGKLSRKLVAQALEPVLAASDAGDAPRGNIETLVAERFADATGIDGPVGRDDNFFMLGGDSLSGVRLSGTLARELGVSLAPDALFRHPTPASLASAIASAQPRESSDAAIDPEHLPVPDGIADYWVQERLSPPSLARHRITRLRVSSAVPIERVQEALDALVRVHPVFRLRLRAVGRRVKGRLGEAYRVPLVTGSEHGVEAFVREPFEMEAGPLLRACRVRGEANEDVLVLCAHHLTMDARSEEIVDAYVSRRLREPFVPALSTDEMGAAERRFALALREVVPSDDERSRAASAALVALKGAPVIVPTMVESPRVGAWTADELAPQRWSNATLAATLIGSWHRKRMLSGASRDGVYRLVTSIRTSGESADVCGFFVDAVPLRLNMTAGVTPEEAAKCAARAIGDALGRLAGTLSAIERHSRAARAETARWDWREAPLLNVGTCSASSTRDAHRSTLDDHAPDGSLECRLSDGDDVKALVWSGDDTDPEPRT